MDERLLRLLESQVDKWRIRTKDEEERKTYDEVFDRSTLFVLQKLISEGTIDILDYPIATGKEGNVFRGSGSKGARAVKIYRTSTATFRRIRRYIEGDTRFARVGGSRRDIIFAWAGKEFKNLTRMRKHKVRVPKPYRCVKNVLVMGYIGTTRKPAPELREVDVRDPQRLFDLVLEDMQRIHASGLVHGDLSEYNILWWRQRPYIIDVGQAVPLEHPHAGEWFHRDMTNMSRFFRRVGTRVSPERLAELVRGG